MKDYEDKTLEHSKNTYEISISFIFFYLLVAPNFVVYYFW